MGQKFGGIWTEIKLDCVRSYLEAYLQALKFQSFEKLYLDAFAGTGAVEIRDEPPSPTSNELSETEEVSTRLLDGSARQALDLSPPFDKYVFIERRPKRAAELQRLCLACPGRALQVINGDANSELRRLCAPRWLGKRGVLFLDPFGMSVEWTTLEAVAATQAIDMWYLYPISAVNRLLCRDGEIDAAWRAKLDLIHGNSEWSDLFYRTKRNINLFEDYESKEKTAKFDAIADYFVSRLKTIFGNGVAGNPLFLCNSTGSPLFLLCFAAGNPKGAKIAVNIAQHILGIS